MKTHEVSELPFTREETQQFVTDAATAGYTHVDLTNVEMISGSVAAELLLQAETFGLQLRVAEGSIVAEMFHVTCARRAENDLAPLHNVYTIV